MYVEQNGGRSILREYNETRKINETSRRKLVNIVTDLVIERFGLHPTKDQKISVAKATIDVFKCFRVENSTNDGIVSNFFL